mgnify:CR=1 FL=1
MRKHFLSIMILAICLTVSAALADYERLEIMIPVHYQESELDTFSLEGIRPSPDKDPLGDAIVSMYVPALTKQLKYYSFVETVSVAEAYCVVRPLAMKVLNMENEKDFNEISVLYALNNDGYYQFSVFSADNSRAYHYFVDATTGELLSCPILEHINQSANLSN